MVCDTIEMTLVLSLSYLSTTTPTTNKILIDCSSHREFDPSVKKKAAYEHTFPTIFSVAVECRMWTRNKKLHVWIMWQDKLGLSFDKLSLA